MDPKEHIAYEAAAANNTANSGNSVVDIKDLVDGSNSKAQQADDLHDPLD